MRTRLSSALLASIVALGTPSVAIAQGTEPPASFQSYLFVLMAFAAGWVVVGAWVFRIGSKVNELARRIDEESGESGESGD